MEWDRRTQLAFAGVLAAAALIGLPSLNAPPLLDDNDELAYVQGIGSASQLLRADCYGLFRPVKNLVFFTLTRLAPGDRIAWHGVSLLVYLTAAGLAMFVFSLLFRNRLTGIAAGAVWALAPTQVSAISWLSCLNIVLAAAALFAALAAREAAQDFFGREDKRAARASLLGAGALYLFALFSYESAVAFPALLILWDGARGRRWRQWRQLLPVHALFWALTLAYLVLLLAVRSNLKINNPSFSPLTPFRTSLASAYFICDHLFAWLWPFGRQSLLGTFVWSKAAMPRLLTSWAFVAVAGVFVFRRRRRISILALGLAWFLVAFLPTSNLIPVKNGPFADYYLVLPGAGLALALTGLVSHLWIRVFRDRARNPVIRRTALVACVLIVCWRLAAAAIAPGWARAWNSPVELYRRALRARPEAFTVRANLAREYLLAGRLDEAEKLSRESLAAAPWYDLSYYVLGDTYLRRGQYEEARDVFNESLRVAPGSAYPHFALGYIQEKFLRDDAGAEKYYREALSRGWTQFSPEVTLNLSRLLILQGRLDEAIAVLEFALTRVPSSADLHSNAAVAYRQKGDENGARRHLDACRRFTGAAP